MRMIRVIGEWANAHGAEEVHIHATSGIDPERTDNYLHLFWFAAYGRNYAVQV